MLRLEQASIEYLMKADVNANSNTYLVKSKSGAIFVGCLLEAYDVVLSMPVRYFEHPRLYTSFRLGEIEEAYRVVA